jgi:hypothetical protein
MAGSAGAQQPQCEGHSATIVGNPGSDQIVGKGAPDVIVAGDGRIRFRAVAAATSSVPDVAPTKSWAD